MRRRESQIIISGDFKRDYLMAIIKLIKKSLILAPAWISDKETALAGWVAYFTTQGILVMSMCTSVSVCFCLCAHVCTVEVLNSQTLFWLYDEPV